MPLNVNISVGPAPSTACRRAKAGASRGRLPGATGQREPPGLALLFPWLLTGGCREENTTGTGHSTPHPKHPLRPQAGACHHRGMRAETEAQAQATGLDSELPRGRSVEARPGLERGREGGRQLAVAASAEGPAAAIIICFCQAEAENQKAKALQRAAEGQLSIPTQASPLWSLGVACGQRGLSSDREL